MLKTSNIKSMAKTLRDMKNPPVKEVEVEESTAAYAKSLEKIAKDKQLKMLTKSERESLKKIAALLAKERKLAKEDTDKSEPGTQGDKEEYQKKRKEIANKFGVES